MLIENVTPKDNNPQDPLNKYVDVKSILTHERDVYLDLIREEFENIGVDSSPLDLLNAINVIFLEHRLSEALVKRQKNLLEKKYIRENEALGILKGEVASVLKETVFNKSITVEMVESIQHKLTTFSQSRNVCKIMAYPVVKDELLLVVGRNCETEDSCFKSLLYAIEPYLHEAIHIEDNEVMDTVSNEIALARLVRSLYDPLKIALRQGISFARRVDTLLRNNDSVIQEVKAAMSQVIRQSISLLHLESIEPLNTTSMDENTYIQIVRRFKFVSGVKPLLFILTSTTNSLSIASHNPDMKWTFINVRAIGPIQELVSQECEGLIEKEYLSYFNLHANFSMENKLNLIEFVKRSLDTKYKDIRQIDFESKSIFKIKHPLMDTSEYQQKDVIGSYSRVQAFMNEVEEHAGEQYGFPRGAFKLSKAFFGVLESIFPTMNSFFPTTAKEEEEASPEKEEL